KIRVGRCAGGHGRACWRAGGPRRSVPSTGPLCGLCSSPMTGRSRSPGDASLPDDRVCTLVTECRGVKIKKIGVIGAMNQEIALLLRDMKHVNQETVGKGKGVRTYCHGSLYGKDAILVFSRWGKVASASTVTTLIGMAGVDLILFTGVAGAISADLHIGDVVIGNRLVQHDLDARPLYPR